MCVEAVDELQIAAAIEAHGINDKAAQERYGMSDVFELARHLYATVPLRAPDSPAKSPPRSLITNDLLRGVIYLAPAFLYLGLGRITDLEQAAQALFGSLILVWALSQGMVFLQQRLLGRKSTSEAHLMVRIVALSGVALVTIATGLYVLVEGLAGAVFGAAVAQTVYFLSASVLFSIRAEKRLLAMLLPGAVVGGVSLTPWGHATISSGVLLLALIGTVVAVATQAMLASRVGARGVRVSLAPGEVGAGFRHVTQGFLWASFVVAGAFAGAGGFSHPTVSLAALPLVLSLGVAEWQVRTFGERTQKLLGRHSDPRDFGTGSLVELGASSAAYTGVVGLLSLGVAGVLGATGRLDARAAELLVAYAVLAFAMFIGLVLTSRGAVGFAMLGSASGLAALGVAEATFGSDPGLDASAYLVATVVFAVVLTGLAVIHVPRPVVP